MEAFPPNSQNAKRVEQRREVPQVTSATARRRKQPLGRKFHNVFFGGDARTAVEYMIGNVLIPAAKDAIVEAASSGFEKLVYGDARPRRGGRGYSPPQSGPLGYVSYNQRPGPPGGAPAQQQQSRLSRQSRTRHNFDEIVINTRQEAEEVRERLFDCIAKYDSVSVADLYEMTGLKSDHTDFKWGWTDLRGTSVGRLRSGGYVLDLPDPEYFD